MESLGFKEKRASARFPVKILLRYFNLNLPGEARAETQDISARGLCLLTRGALATDTPLDIWLQMPDNGDQINIG